MISAKVFSLGFLLLETYEMGAFHLEKIEREKSTGVLVDNRVEFKPLVQWGQKKVKSDLKTS